MSEVVIPLGYAQIQLHWNGLSPMGSSPINSFGVSVEPDWDPEPYYGAVQAAVQNLLNPLDSSWAVDLIRTRIGASGGPPYVFQDVATPGLTGGVTGSSNPPNVSVLLQYTTVVAGRGGRGRTFLPGVPESEVDDAGTVSADLRGDIAVGIGAMFSDLEAVGVTGLVVLHGESSPLAGTGSVVTGIAISSVAATQRRRLRR